MYQLERFRFAALKYSDGKLPLLEGAVQLAKEDWRDLLLAAGFGYDVEAHGRWEPNPAGGPAEIDRLALLAGIHSHLSMTLVPLGFARKTDEWRRQTSGGISQSLEVATGLMSRTETRFLLRARLDGGVKPVAMLLPRLGSRANSDEEQCYRFRAGESEEALYAAVSRDTIRFAHPWFLRFMTSAEIARGFQEGTFDPHLDVDGCALLL